jgi:hypothetical protein
MKRSSSVAANTHYAFRCKIMARFAYLGSVNSDDRLGERVLCRGRLR